MTIENTGAGHHVPTDSPLRHLILLVTASDAAGTVLRLVDGPVLPDSAGMETLNAATTQDCPGIAYAKVLEELWTGVVANRGVLEPDPCRVGQ